MWDAKGAYDSVPLIIFAVSSRLISGMPSLTSEHSQRVHYYTTTTWNVLSTQMHFVLPICRAS